MEEDGEGVRSVSSFPESGGGCGRIDPGLVSLESGKSKVVLIM